MTWTRIRVGGVLVLDSQTLIDQLDSFPEWGDSINRLECRVGAEPSYGTFLVPANALETIPTDGPFNIVWQYNDDSTTHTVTFAGYSLIDSFTCANVHDSPLVITVGDARHNYAKAFTHKRFNCQRFFDRNLIEGTAASLTMPFSVAEIIDDILDDLPFSSLSMPSDRDLYNLYFDYTPAWQALSRVADLCGYRLGYDPYNGTPIAIEIQPDPNPTALPSGVTRVNVTGDRLFQTPDYSDAANQLRVIFDRKPFHTDALTARQSHVLDRSGVSGAAPNTVEAIYATLLAESNDWTDHTANPVNYAAMMAEADWFASTYTIVQEIEANKQSKTFRGLYQIPLSHAVKSLAWQAIGAQTFTEWETGCDVPPSWLSPNTVHVGKSQYLFFTPEDGIPGRASGSTQAEFVDCKPYYLNANGELVQLFGSDGSEITYPVWNISETAIPGETYVLARPVSGRIVADVGGGSGAQIIQFSLVGQEDYPDEYEYEKDETLCENKVIASAPYLGEVVKTACGASRPVFGEDYEGMVELADDLGILENRDRKQLANKTGIAVLLKDEESEYAECYWCIVYIDFHREIQVVTDIIFQENMIVVERKLIKVWDDCKLPDEEIEGIDCDEDDAYDGGGI